MPDPVSIWVFNGARSTFPSGVFTRHELAEEWIRMHALTGTLTQYPVDTGMYEYAIAARSFTPKKPEHATSEFVARFSGGGLDHWHYENGLRGCAG
jgi:hypothetical protein